MGVIDKPLARVEVALGLLGRHRPLARLFEEACDSGAAWLQVACVTVLLRANANPASVTAAVA